MKSEAFISLKEGNGAEPLYMQIYGSIRDAILDGRLESRSRVPSSRQLAEKLGISRMTVVNAYDQLFAEGYLEGRRGSGTFVASRLPEDFLRAKTRPVSEANQHKPPRSVSLSNYGKRISRDTVRIADHHSASNVVPFQHSVISSKDFPFEVWAKLNQKHLKYSTNLLGGYGDSAGFAPLRETIADHLRSTRGVRCDAGQVVITAGTQQAIFLIAKLLLEPNDEVWLEDPCHLGTRDVMTAMNAKVVNIPVDDEGLDISRANRRKRPSKLVYVTPSRQFPLGVTMTLRRRLSLLEWAKDNKAWIIEDDYDSEFRYTGRPLPALQGLDRDERVLYVGTFSKTGFPGLRLGCLVLPPDLVDVFKSARSLIDLHSPLIDQMVLADFISEGHFERHVRRMRTLYHERQLILVHEAKKYLNGLVDVQPSDAGMHLIGWLPDGVDDRSVSEHLRGRGLLASPLSRYTDRKLERSGLLLGYTAFNDRQIKKGVQDLAAAFDSFRLGANSLL